MRKRLLIWLLAGMLSCGTAAVIPAAAVYAAEAVEGIENPEETGTQEEPETTAAAEVPETTAAAEEEPETKAAEEEAEDDLAMVDLELTAETAEEKLGNCDEFIGLSKNYWVMATAKKKVYVYESPSTDSKVLGKFTKNNCVVVNTNGMKKGTRYTWLKVWLKKKCGYVQLKNVTLGKLDKVNFGLSANSKQNLQRIQICRFGIPYMGTKFVLGGSSLTKGIDCSTFARKAMRNAGVMVSSSALAVNLSNTGKAIKRSQLKPGDMVFYYHDAKDRRIGHCAIYIGEGYIINASGHQGKVYPSGGIRISRIDYRSPTAVKFRNLVGN